MTLPAHYFEFYGLPLALQVDQQQLRSAYLAYSRKFHPDFHTLATEQAQAEALEWSTYNNEAYKTLSDPDRLLSYVLKIKGLLSDEGKGNEKLPQEFLMDMMDLNEKIMELEFDPSEHLYRTAQDQLKTFEAGLESDFGPVRETWIDADGDTDNTALTKAKDYFLKKRYLLRVKENLSKFAAAFEKP